MRARLALIAMSLVCLIATASTASAEDMRNEIDGYFFAKLLTGFGGEGELDADGLGGEFEGDLEFSYGLGAGYMHPLHEYFALGGQLSLLSWQSEAGEDGDLDRNSLLDLSVVPEGKYLVLDNLELFATLPLGLSFDFLGEDDFGNLAEVGTGFGFNLGLMLGARVAIDEQFGLLAELGYVYHSFSHATETAVGEGPDLDVSLGQLSLNIGGYFQL
jgi:opacity protein-like surface antigen